MRAKEYKDRARRNFVRTILYPEYYSSTTNV